VAKRLDEFVKNGGILVTDCRTGVKDETGLAHERTLPGLLSETLGIRIEEYEAVPAKMSYSVKSDFGDLAAIQYADWITPENAQVIGQFTAPWHMTDFAAITKNNYGTGQGWYLGAVFQGDEFYDAFVKRILSEAGITPIISTPQGVEIAVRAGSKTKFVFIINHTDDIKTVDAPEANAKIILGKKTGRHIELDRYGVAVLQF
jgi:beta-galactosidase